MYLKNYSEKYKQAQIELHEDDIEIELKDKKNNIVEYKIIMWKLDFEEILSKIPLNKDGELVALAYHNNIDWPWEEMDPEPWTMDCLEESLEQLKYIENKIEDEERRMICKDMIKIVEKAITDEKEVLIKVS